MSVIFGDDYLYTYVEFSIEDVLVGTDDLGETLTLRFTGGSAGGVELDLGVLIPKMGERGIYFVERVSPGLINPLLGWEQGHFVVNDNGSVVAGNSLLVESIELQSRFSSSEISAGVAIGINTSLPLRPDADPDASAAAKNLPMSVIDFKQTIRELRQ